MKLGVKSDDTEHLADGDVDLLADFDQNILRKISEYLLSLLQNRYHTAFRAPIPVQKLVQLFPGLL